MQKPRAACLGDGDTRDLVDVVVSYEDRKELMKKKKTFPGKYFN